MAALIAIHRRFTSLIADSLDGDARFTKSLDEAFQHVMNVTVNPLKSPQILAHYCDMVLKKDEGADASTNDAVGDFMQCII